MKIPESGKITVSQKRTAEYHRNMHSRPLSIELEISLKQIKQIKDVLLKS